MQTKVFSKGKAVLLILASTLILSACGKPSEPPDQVMKKFMQAISQVKSGDMTAKVAMKGADDKGSIDFNADLAIKFDRRDNGRKADIGVNLSGNMNSAGKLLDGVINFNIVTVGEEFYVQLAKLESSDESIKKAQPFLAPYMNKWLHLASDFIPENLRNLQNQDPVAIKKEDDLKKLLAESTLFTVTKEYGVETINGNDTYHYAIQFSPDALKEYTKKAAQIDGRELTEAEINDSASLATTIKNAELWIGTGDYNLYKAVIGMNGDAVDRATTVGIDITMEGDSFNKDVTIAAPKDAQEFNPLALMMAGSGAGGAPGAEGDAPTGTGANPADGAAAPAATGTGSEFNGSIGTPGLPAGVPSPEEIKKLQDQAAAAAAAAKNK